MRGRQIIVAATVTCVAVAVLVLYYFVDPGAARWSPKCMFHELTGWDCPGCGFQRALHALLHGRPREAWGYNPFLFIILPIAAALGVIEAGRGRWPKVYQAIYRPSTFIAILALILGWTLLRNIIGI